MKRKKSIAELTHCSVEEYRKLDKLPLSILIDNVRSMHNIGALFRTADAFLIDEIILSGISGTPPHQEISKSALGAEESVAWRYVDDAYSEVMRMKEKGWKILVLEQTHQSISLERFKIGEEDKYLLIVGNEVHGVDQRIVDASDIVLEIPQHGTKHSLNVSTSAAIAMWEIYKQLI